MFMAYRVDTNSKAVKEKIEQVRDAISDMKKYRTVALLDLRRLPTSLFQSLRKRIREDGGRVLVLKKPVISRVLAANPKLKTHVADCDKPVALIYTNHSPYEINSFFKQNRKKRAAKVGDVAVADIVVPEGETDLPPRTGALGTQGRRAERPDKGRQDSRDQGEHRGQGGREAHHAESQGAPDARRDAV